MLGGHNIPDTIKSKIAALNNIPSNNNRIHKYLLYNTVYKEILKWIKLIVGNTFERITL